MSAVPAPEGGPSFEVHTEAAAGRLLVHKRALDPRGAAALRAEADMLRAARHPGVVALVDHDETTRTLTTAHAGHRTLADAATQDAAVGLRLLVSAAEVLADLHALGIVHGSVAAGHVIVAAGDRAVLCGLRHAGRLGEPYDADHERSGEPRLAADDIAGLGTLLGPLVDDPHLAGRSRRALASLAAAAGDPEASRRPGARRFAATVLLAVPEAGHPTPAGAASDSTAASAAAATGHRRRGAAMTGGRPRPGAVTPTGPSRRTVLGLAITALAGTVLVAVGVVGAAASGTDEAALTPTVTTSPPRLDAPPAGAPAVITTGPDVADPPEPATAHDSPGAETVRPTIVHDGTRFAVGEAGDEVAVGDWDCDGGEEVVVLRPATGVLHRFASWATVGRDAYADPVANLPPGSHLDGGTAAGCGIVAVIDPSGAATAVDLADRGVAR